MQVNRKLIDKIRRNVEHSQGGDISKRRAGVVGFNGMHHDVRALEVQTARNSSREELEDLLCSSTGLRNERIVEPVRKPNLAKRRVLGGSWNSTGWLNDSRHA